LHEGKTFLLVKRLIDEKHVRAIVVYASKDISINEEVVNTHKSFLVPIGQNSKNNIYNF